MSELDGIKEGAKELARLVLGNPRQADGLAVSAPLDNAVPGIGGIYNGEDLADEQGHGMPPDVIERALDVPSGKADPTAPQLDQTEWLIEHQDQRHAERTFERVADARHGAERLPVRDVYSIGGDVVTIMRVSVDINGLSNQPVLRKDPRRLRFRVKVITAASTVYMGATQTQANEGVGWPIATADGQQVLDSSGEIWFATANAQATPVVIAILTETRNMPRTV